MLGGDRVVSTKGVAVAVVQLLLLLLSLLRLL